MIYKAKPSFSLTVISLTSPVYLFLVVVISVAERLKSATVSLTIGYCMQSSNCPTLSSMHCCADFMDISISAVEYAELAMLSIVCLCLFRSTPNSSTSLSSIWFDLSSCIKSARLAFFSPFSAIQSFANAMYPLLNLLYCADVSS